MGKIVILNRRYCPGEAWTNRFLAYAKGFAEHGQEVVIYYLIADKNRTPYSINIPGVKIVNLWEQDGWLCKHFRILSFLKNLLRFKKEIMPHDYVLFSGLHNYQFYIANRIRKYTKVFCESTEHPAVFKKRNPKDYERLKNNLNKLNGLFVISQSLKDFYVSIGVSKEKIHIINMFVDTTRFSGLSKNKCEKYIAYCGAVSYDKDGVNTLIEAFALFNKSHADYKLYIIGKGVTPSTISNLKELSLALGISNNVVFTGAVPPNKMPQILYDAKILALARPNNLQAQNGFPTKLGEYLATGNPVVVTRVGDIPLFIKHKKNGFLSDPDAKSFAEQLSWIAEHYEEAITIGLNGKSLADNDFSYLSQSKKVINKMNI